MVELRLADGGQRLTLAALERLPLRGRQRRGPLAPPLEQRRRNHDRGGQDQREAEAEDGEGELAHSSRSNSSSSRARRRRRSSSAGGPPAAGLGCGAGAGGACVQRRITSEIPSPPASTAANG